MRRQLTFRAGQLFQQSKLRESQRKLYAMELFNFVNVESVGAVGEGAARQEGEADQIATRVTVTEGKHRKVNFGFGYGTEEQARGEIDWRHVNFFGGARTAGVFARYSALDRGVRLNFRQPYFFSPRYSFGMSGQSWFSDEPAYKLTTVGGRATVAREFGRKRAPLGARQTTTLALTYANEWEDYTVSEEALNDPTFRDDLIALGIEPGDRCRHRPAFGAAARCWPEHDREHPRCQEGLRRQHSPRDRRDSGSAVTATIGRSRRRAATTRRSGGA